MVKLCGFAELDDVPNQPRLSEADHATEDAPDPDPRASSSLDRSPKVAGRSSKRSSRGTRASAQPRARQPTAARRWARTPSIRVRLETALQEDESPADVEIWSTCTTFGPPALPIHHAEGHSPQTDGPQAPIHRSVRQLTRHTVSCLGSFDSRHTVFSTALLDDDTRFAPPWFSQALALRRVSPGGPPPYLVRRVIGSRSRALNCPRSPRTGFARPPHRLKSRYAQTTEERHSRARFPGR